ncbi:hypothetical protein Moror_3059 [Moniliophthora roreri MCA 2997]|uniref:Uncharacterized protein n=1 Tax=Moniliophthora roreri (strain MCA 2997) TaxID=1381753 RepID=V2X7B3_MONRO|nr:hypothetical protein Moror_3059 [Moniliophthora roreri MCA 2997]
MKVSFILEQPLQFALCARIRKEDRSVGLTLNSLPISPASGLGEKPALSAHASRVGNANPVPDVQYQYSTRNYSRGAAPMYLSQQQQHPYDTGNMSSTPADMQWLVTEAISKPSRTHCERSHKVANTSS